MDAKNSRVVVRLLPSLTDFAFLMPIVFLFGRMEGMQTLLGDCDTGWHIRTGQWILQNHRVPFQDLFSYSKPGGPWYAWEWLSDIVLAALYSLGGLRAIALAAILLLSVSFTLLYFLARRKSNPVIAILVTMAGAAASSVHWLARPHLFTLFFVVVFYVVLERVREGKRAALWLLVPATALWTNLHGGFFVGIAMIGAYGAGEVLAVALAAERHGWQSKLRSAGEYFGCAAACLAASLLNPYTWRLHQHVIEFLGDSYIAQHIMEYMSISFHHPLAMFFEALLLGGALASAWYISQGRYIEPLLYLMWAHAALLASRNIPIAMILTVPMVSEVAFVALDRLPRLHVANWLRVAGAKFNAVTAGMCETDALPRTHAVSAAGVVLVAALLWAPNPPKRFRAEFDPKSFPAGAIETLARIPSARIFTFDQWGDYLIYRLYPNHKVFVDGRCDYFGSDFEKKVADIVSVNHGWDKTLAQFGVDTILMPPSSPLTGVLKESSRWRVVYDDGVSLVFRPKGGGATISAADGSDASQGLPVRAFGGGTGRDREVTKTQASDQPILKTKSKT
jgi:hypothetical protein